MKDSEIALSVCEKVKSLIEKGWCQKVQARNNNNNPVGIAHKKASKFCLLGAIHKAHLEVGCPGAVVNEITFSLIRKIGNRDIACWNDTLGRTQEEVINLINAVIKDFENETI